MDYLPTVLIKSDEHEGGVLINASDFVEGVHVLYAEGEAQEKQGKPKKK